MTLRVRGVVFDAMPGDSVEDAVREAMQQANWPGAPATFLTFNGATIHIERGASLEALVAAWGRIMDARAVA